MTETDLVGNSTPEGAGENQPPVSQGEGKPIASTATQTQDFVSKKEYDLLMKEVRGLQSRQDKSQTEQTRFMAELKEQLAKGLSIEEAEKAVNENQKAREKDELLIQIAQKVGVLPSVSQTQTTGNSATETVDVAKVVQEYGLDGNDPEVISSLLSKNFNSPMEVELAAARILRNRVNPSTPSPVASTAVSSGSSVQPTNSTPALTAKLEELQKNPTKNWREIKKITAVLDERGWK